MTSTPSKPPVPGRVRMFALGLGVPVVVVVAAAALLHSWVPQLPAQVAVHWSGQGPDGFAAASGLWWTPLLALIGPALIMPVGLLLGRDALTRRICLATSWFITVFVVGIILSTAGAQRGLADAHAVGDIDWLISLSLGAAILVGVAGWMLVPGDPEPDTPAHLDPTTAHLVVRPGERIVWTQVVRTRYLVPITAAILAVVCLVLVVLRVWSALIPLALTAVLVLLLEALMLAARVTVDSAGLRVTLGPGIHVRQIPARDIQDVTVVDIHPLRDFGGYGVRTGRSGIVGVVMRKGPGIQVTLPDGRRFAVTVDDAQAGAKALATVALQAQGAGGSH